MTNADERVALCALNRIFGYQPRLALELMEKAGGALTLFTETPPPLPENPELAAALTPESLEWGRAELERVRSGGFRFLCLPDDEYPDVLRDIPDPPLGLYLKGCSSPAELFELHPLVGIVGTRDLSPYGRAWCRKLVEGLSRARTQPCIVSGLALGADGIAHRSALDYGLPTIGVMATGIEKVYPWQHESLAREIAATPYCSLLTDYPFHTAPLALNFLRRNRIIAALVQAVLVVESKSKGGSLMTARYAVEYGREVYALPGRADDLRSAGCNSLIRENMAEIITTPEDLAARLGLGSPVHSPGGSWKTLSPEQLLRERLTRQYGADSLPVLVGLCVREQRGISVEQLSARLRRSLPDVLAAAGTLEADHFLSTDLFRRCSLLPPWD